MKTFGTFGFVDYFWGMGGEKTSGAQIFSLQANQIVISPKWRKNRI